MKKLIGCGVLVLGMCAVSAPALADQDEGFYFGVGAGQSEFADFTKGDLDSFFRDDLRTFGLLPGAISSSADDQDTTFSFFAGYRVLPYLAVEIGYTDLGKATYRGSTTATDPIFGGDPFAANTTIEFEANGVMASAVGIYPFSDLFDVHGRLGLLFSRTDLTINRRLDDGITLIRFRTTQAESAVDGVVSVGAGFNVTPYLHLSLDYQLFSDVGDDNTAKTDVNTLTLSVDYRY